jgi:hypothetical protein
MRQQQRDGAGRGGSGENQSGRSERSQSRSKRSSSRAKSSLYTFTDGLERCICRNATRAPARGFPATRREDVGTPRFIELARSDSMILLCDLLHEGPHLWPDGEQALPSPDAIEPRQQ